MVIDARTGDAMKGRLRQSSQGEVFKWHCGVSGVKIERVVIRE